MRLAWQQQIDYVWVKPGVQASVRFTISPCEKALLDKGLLTREELMERYREAIELGDFTLFEIAR